MHTVNKRRRGLQAAVALTTLLGVSGLLTVTAFAADPPTSLHVNFQPTSVTVPAGYTKDIGTAYNGTSGWQNASGTAIDMTANTRVRKSASSPNVQSDTQILVQAPAGSGNTTPGRYVASLANGSYSVTVGVGDPTALNSNNEITANGVVVINHFVPTSGNLFQVVTQQVTVTNGTLTLDPTGGTNTKLDFLDVVPVSTPDTTPPVVTVTPSGTSSGAANSYTGDVTITSTATDNVGVASWTYTVDGGTALPYTAPFVVNSTGSHVVAVTATDAASPPNATTVSSSFSIVAAPASPTSLHVNFQAAATPAPPAGYTADYGLAYSDASGSGWENQSTGVPTSLVGNGRVRNSSVSPDKRYDTLMQMQQATAQYGGTATPGKWEAALANGIYDVTVAVGDATAINSSYVIKGESGTANAVTLVNGYVPTTAAPFFTSPKTTVTVSDGKLSLDAIGGTNTKIDFLDVTPHDVTAPTASVSLSGTQDTGGNYTTNVTATVTAADEVGGSGLASVTYSLDGGAATPYTTPVVVTTNGNHTITATATDNATNSTTTAVTSWTEQKVLPAPTATVTLAGTQGTGGIYTTDVQATITSTDNSGTGLASTSYTLDGGVSTPYTGPITVSADGSHTINVSVMDNANNTGTATSSWTEDKTAPTASVTLSGTQGTGGIYTTDVVATVASADPSGGAGLASTSYTLDGGAATPYTAPITVSTDGSHTITVTVTDNAGNTLTTAPTTWTEDKTLPTASVALAGTQDPGGVYITDVTATITSGDPTGGSGLASTTYTLDGGASTPYTTPITVTADSTSRNHTLAVTVTDNAGNVGTATSTWTELQQVVVGAPVASVSAPQDAILKLGTHRLVFGTVSSAASAPLATTFTNTGTGTLTISNIAISGTNASEFALDAGQPTTLNIAAGASATVNVTFVPVASTNCPTSANLSPIGNVNRTASLTYSTNDTTTPGNATGAVDLAGVNACGHEGNYEPTLSQLMSAFGYTDKVNPSGSNQRSLDKLRTYPLTDEVQSPYFNVANTSQPVSLVPLAHYSGTADTPYSATGWFLQGKSPGTPCGALTCNQTWAFPADPPGGYNQNQKIFPTPTGSTTFTPTNNAAFGIYSGENAEIGFSDDQFNTAHGYTSFNGVNYNNKNVLGTVHYLHNLRVFPAYGPGHVLIPNTYLIGIDLSRVPNNKNNDYQDVIMVLSNVTPAAPTSVAVGAATTHNLTTGTTVSAGCAVTGFDGVLANNGTVPACSGTGIVAGPTGLSLTSTAGQLADGKQQNALYQNFDATKGQFAVKARIVGPINQLTQQYQQGAVWFGPDIKNFLKVETDFQGTGSGTDPHITMQYDEKGVVSPITTVSVPGLTTASTVDLKIVGNTQFPDPETGATDPNQIQQKNYPLAQLTAFYSLDGGVTWTQIGAATNVKYPADLESWFATNAKAGILVSSGGSSTPVTMTFSNFTIATS
jgi:hypothetical protein